MKKQNNFNLKVGTYFVILFRGQMYLLIWLIFVSVPIIDKK